MSLYGDVLDVVERAVYRNRWDEALLAALEAWRARRLPRLADLVDVLGARHAVGQVSPTTLFAWCDAAATYDPLTVEPLLASFGTRLPYDGVRRADLAERRAEIERPMQGVFRGDLAPALYLSSWPADPRTAHALVDWYERLDDASWPGQGNPEALVARRAVYWAVGPGLVNLADVRMRERLEALAQRPPGAQKWTRAVQVEAARPALAVLDGLEVPAATEGELARFDALLAQLGGARELAGPPRARPSFAPDELWRQIAAAPDDDGPRMALADQLLERGDPRGVVFAHQLQRATRNDINRLVRRHWANWLGEDLARLLLRKRSEFVRGMLDTVTVGRDSPGWLFAAAEDHRELLVVRRVFPNRIHPPHYARLVASLTHVRTVGIDRPGLIDALIEGAQPALAQLTTLHWLEWHPITELARLAPFAPNVTAIAVQHVMPPDEDQAALHRAFPRLASIQVQSAP